MEAKVIRAFRCKYTKKRYRSGDVYEHELERIKYLQEAGYLEDTSLLVSKASEEVAGDNSFQLMSKKEIEKTLRQHGINFNTRQPKAELIELLKKL